MKDIAIKVDRVSKQFELPHRRSNSMKGLFMNILSPKGTAETQTALRDISFEVKKGEFFGIVGRNGSGKSTLLKILAGIYQPTKGNVAVDGRLVPFIELGVGFNPELSGRENVYLNGALLGFSQKFIDKKYKDIVDFAELKRFMDQKLKNYSSGMQVRLAFSVATILAESDILLIDEVLAVGDADFQRKCFNYFRNIKKKKKTVVFVSHDMSAVRQYCDRAILIEDSKLVAEGSSDKIATQYTRMFNDGGNVEQVKDNKGRWGNKKIVIKSTEVLPDRVSDKKEQMKIKTTLTPNEDVDNPVVGFVIKSSSGKSIMGTNTRMDNFTTGYLKAGVNYEVIWTFDNIFPDGDYSIDIAVLESDAATVCEWWEGVKKFRSNESSPSPYFASPHTETVMKERPR